MGEWRCPTAPRERLPSAGRRLPPLLLKSNTTAPPPPPSSPTSTPSSSSRRQSPQGRKELSGCECKEISGCEGKESMRKFMLKHRLSLDCQAETLPLSHWVCLKVGCWKPADRRRPRINLHGRAPNPIVGDGLATTLPRSKLWLQSRLTSRPATVSRIPPVSPGGFYSARGAVEHKCLRVEHKALSN